MGGIYDDFLRTVMQTSDGGYIAGGYSESIVSGDKTEMNCELLDPKNYDYWIVKLSNIGNLEWDKAVGGSEDDWFTDLDQTTDGGYILGGYSNSPASCDKSEGTVGLGGNDDYWVVKLAPEAGGCETPTGLFVDNITATKAKLHWDAVPTADKYKVYYKPFGAAIPWTQSSATLNVKKLTGLNPSTTYEYKVRSICTTEKSDVSPIQTFTTLPLRSGEDLDTDITIYPNPATDDFTVNLTLNNSAGEQVVMNIYNLLGDVVYTHEFALLNGTLSEHIVLGNLLPGGIYIVKLKTADTEYMQELIIQK